MTLFRLLLAVTVILPMCRLSSASADTVEEYTAKSILALNLARFSEWPPEAFKNNNGSIDLCLAGDLPESGAFGMIDKKPVGDKTLLVRTVSDGKQLEHCHLLYISQEKSKFAGLIEESYKQHILTIGETEDFLASGGVVYLEVVDAKITLHVNVGAMEKTGVRISSRVLKLASIYTP